MAGITQSRGAKSDKRDAYALAEKLRVGNLDRSVFKAPWVCPYGCHEHARRGGAETDGAALGELKQRVRLL